MLMIKETQTIYSSPKVKFAEIKTRQMLCGSPYDSGINDLSRDENTEI